MKLLKALPTFCFGIVILGACVILSSVGYLFWQIHMDQENSINQISTHLNIPANEETIKNYVYCDLISIGASLSEVESNLLVVGKYRVFGEENMKRYVFDDPNNADLLGEIHLTYDNNWILIEKGKRAGFGDYSQFVCETK